MMQNKMKFSRKMFFKYGAMEHHKISLTIPKANTANTSNLVEHELYE